MTRISGIASHAVNKAQKPVFKSSKRNAKVTSPPSRAIGMEERWQDRAGEEIEDSGNYSPEECHFAQEFAHDHGDFEDGLD